MILQSNGLLEKQEPEDYTSRASTDTICCTLHLVQRVEGSSSDQSQCQEEDGGMLGVVHGATSGTHHNRHQAQGGRFLVK